MWNNPMHKIFWFLTLFVAAFMSPAHAREAQTCDDKTIEAVAAWAEVKGKLVSADEEQDGLIVAAACKAMPNAPGTTIAAIAFETSHVDHPHQGRSRSILQIIALVEAGKVVAANRSDIEEDASVKFSRGSYGIDTARYILSKDVRAFGVVFNSTASNGCPDGGLGNELTLWIREGKNLRVVFETPLYRWARWSDCRNTDVEFEHSCNPSGCEEWREDATMTISVEKSSSHGFADLAIIAHVNCVKVEGFLCSATGKRTVRKVVKYDGQHYRGINDNDSFWWSPLVRQKWGRK